ncbi:hypothetical protein SK069_15330 [Patulibacter brassicae]|uniref:Asl1-like glycosyl hydrolase catalytic domain-containing protein n=1 Tax=Patulibacter brassicae TaxID=1705717 RepID=A0ABU4VNF8_9ACTN|nr:hypothetical protein [Patulibacter brassicae]MDX8152970.1 hypothetical protein [Patulibacter brassicae]
MRAPRVLLALAVVLVAAGAGFLLGRGTAPEDGAPSARPAPGGRDVRATAPQLAVGLDTSEATLLAPPAADAPAFDGARRLVGEIAPRTVRLDVRWDLLQPAAEQPLDPDRPLGDGCGRGGVPPCGGAQTLRAALVALAARQRERPGRFGVLVSFWGMPTWAGAPGSGCEAAAARAGARPLAPGREDAYRAAIRAAAEAAAQAGARIDGWSPWNEPNAPYFLDPQRSTCDADGTGEPVAVGPYGRLVRAMDAELRAGGPARGPLVVGELAAWAAPSRRAVPADEFLRALPDDVLCRADVVSLHGYLEARPRSGRGEPIAAGLAALDRRRCLDGVPAWITETGVGAPRAGGARDASGTILRAECRLMHQQLVRWYHAPRVAAAFQYSVREDRAFPVGLLDERLRRTFPVADVWRAWGARDPTAPPPELPRACRDGAPRGEAAPPG